MNKMVLGLLHLLTHLTQINTNSHVGYKIAIDKTIDPKIRQHIGEQPTASLAHKIAGSFLDPQDLKCFLYPTSSYQNMRKKNTKKTLKITT